jgi:putative MATE family efflux protein
VTLPILPTLVRLAWPNLIAMLASTAVAVAETVYVGALGTPALAGLALVFPLVMLMQMMSAGAMGGGVSSAIARALGGGDVRRAAALALHAVIIGAIAGVGFTLVFGVFARPILAALGGRGEALDAAVTYAQIVFLGAIFVWSTNTLASVLRGTGDMRRPSVVLLLAAALQVVAGGLLGLGFGPVPRLGMVGVALGLVVAFGIATAILLAQLRASTARVRLVFDAALLEQALFKDILKVGALSCASPVMSVATVLVLTALVARLGTEALAGYGIGTRLEFLLVPITFAIGVASVPMVGMAIGAGRIARARQVAWTAGGLAAVLTGTIGITVALWPQAWAGLFTDDPAVRAIAVRYLTLAGPAFALYGLGLALYFASQGSGRMLGPVLAQGLRLLTVVCGSALIGVVGFGTDAVFALVAVSFLLYGLGSAVALLRADWQVATDRRSSPG